jgi:hypothetical protein
MIAQDRWRDGSKPMLGSIRFTTDAPCHGVEIGAEQPITDGRDGAEWKQDVDRSCLSLADFFATYSASDDQFRRRNEPVLKRLADLELIFERAIERDNPPSPRIVVRHQRTRQVACSRKTLSKAFVLISVLNSDPGAGFAHDVMLPNDLAFSGGAQVPSAATRG